MEVWIYKLLLYNKKGKSIILEGREKQSYSFLLVHKNYAVDKHTESFVIKSAFWINFEK